MAFKNHMQRKAVMAKLMNKNYSQLKKSGIKLNKNMDTDKDGVKNIRDCKPLDPRRQGIIHDFIKAKDKYVKQREQHLEVKQDKMLKEIDSEKTTLKKHLAVQQRINDNKKLKQELKELKSANFRMSTTGRILAATQSGVRTIGRAVTSKQAKSLGKKVFGGTPKRRTTKKKSKKKRSTKKRSKRSLDDIYF